MRLRAGCRGFGRATILMMAALLLDGCVKNKVVVQVKPDGSGSIIVTRVFSKEAVAMYEAQMAEFKKQAQEPGALMSMPANTPDDPFYNEDGMKREAGLFGPGVTFVKASKYEKEGRGSVALYAFKDVNDVFINLDDLGAEGQATMMSPPESEEAAPVAKKGEQAIGFQLDRSQTNEPTLRVLIPQFPEATGGDTNAASEAKAEADKPAFEGDGDAQAMLMGSGNPYGFTGRETRGDVMKRVMRGMETSVSVEVIGSVTKSSASHPDTTNPNRFTLFDLNMDKVLESPKAAELVMGLEGMSSGSGFIGSMKGKPGVTMEPQKEVTIRFK